MIVDDKMRREGMVELKYSTESSSTHAVDEMNAKKSNNIMYHGHIITLRIHYNHSELTFRLIILDSRVSALHIERDDCQSVS